MKSTYITIKVDEGKLEEIREFYDIEYTTDEKNPYLIFETKTFDNVIVKAYKSKNHFSITFSGLKEDVINEAMIFEDEDVIKSCLEEKGDDDEKKMKEKGYKDIFSQIGSDEVGVGDLFGPLVVCAAYTNADDIKLLEELGVKDSKKLSDGNILEIGERLCQEIKSSLIICSPNKLNSLKEKGWSMHKIMANIHNQCHMNILKNSFIPNSTKIYVDQFESSELYFKYLVTEKPIESHPYHFETKGEQFYPSIAVASVIARYHFLLEWEKMEKELNISIPKGASISTDKVLQTLIKTHGKDKIKPYVKTFFRNYKDLDD